MADVESPKESFAEIAGGAGVSPQSGINVLSYLNDLELRRLAPAVGVVSPEASLRKPLEPVKKVLFQEDKKSIPPAALPIPSPEVKEPESEYQRLARESRWQELSQYCEGALASSSSEIEARLWWARSQLELDEVPASILAAPVDSVSQLVLEQARTRNGKTPLPAEKELSKLTSYVLCRMSERIKDAGDTVLSFAFLERAYRLDPAHAGRLLETVNYTLNNYPKNGSRALPKREMLEKLKNELAGISRPQVKQSTPVEAVNKEVISSVSGQQQAARRAPHLSSKIIVAASLFMLFCAVMYRAYEKVVYYIDSEPSFQIAMPKVGYEPTLILPAPSRIDDLSSLDGLLYHMEREPAKDAQGEEKEASVKPVVPAEKEVVNTSTPLEGSEFANLISTDVDRAYDVISAPKNGLLPQPRFDDGPDDIDRNDPRLQAVNRFASPQLYKLIVRSDVMARPNYATFKVAELEEGASVYVIEEIGGKWLKIRAGSGKVGYILAQDAMKVGG